MIASNYKGRLVNPTGLFLFVFFLLTLLSWAIKVVVMDKSFFQITSIRQKEDDFWKDRSYSERIEALEELRRIIFGYDPITERLQRILAVTELKGN